MKTIPTLILGMLVILALASTACETIKSRFARQALPDLGPPIALTVQMDVDPSLSKAKIQYIDSCSRIQPLSIGPTVEDLLVQAAHQTFRTVLISGGNITGAKPDVTVRVRMLDPQLKIQADGLYDRKPAELSLDVFAEFYDAAGKLLAERPLQATRKERLQLELTQQRCDYLVDPIVQDTSTMLAAQFMQEARVLLDPTNTTSASPSSVVSAGVDSQPAGLPPTGPVAPVHALSFKATLLDENSNLILEGGERIRVRVDVVNTSPQAVQNIAVHLAGPPILITQFPATKLSAGTIEPGSSKSLEFIATMPQSLHPQQAEFQVSLSGIGGHGALPPQTLLASVQPTGVNTGDVDQIPAMTTGFQRPGDFLLSIGLSSYREQQVPARKYASLDAEMVATYFQSLGGLPRSNVRLLQDWSALRPDIEEALLDWLPSKITKDSVVMVYFAGQAIVSPAGETFLIPYDGALEATTRLYPLKDLETALGRLKAKQILFVFDGTVLKNGADGRTKVSLPKWPAANGSVLHVLATTGFGKSLESDTLRHGLFTYYLLRGLRGEADLNRNGEVTIGEVTAYVTRTVPMMARSTFKQEQQPQVLPVSRSSDRNLDLILTKPPAIPAFENP
ncbi:MAG: caspase family protein [Nitrospira sp.]|nr:caspase family protein [Nitrospira sp.]